MNPLAKEGTRESLKGGRKTIRVVLAEDQGMVLGALAALLEIEGDISVVAQARNGKEALDDLLLILGIDAAGAEVHQRVSRMAGVRVRPHAAGRGQKDHERHADL